MLTKVELEKLKGALPEGAFAQIAEAAGCSYATVQKVMSEPERYKKRIIDAAIKLANKYQKEIEEQRQRIQNLGK